MIPLRDNIPSQRTPVLVIALIVANALVFLVQSAQQEERQQAIAYRFGFLPARLQLLADPGPLRILTSYQRVLTGRGVAVLPQVDLVTDAQWRKVEVAIETGRIPEPPGLRVYVIPNGLPAFLVSAFTMMFLHGGWMHIIGNMWYLWVFGDNVEDRLGHQRFIALYFLSGLAGCLLHLVFNWGSAIPAIGASGAVAGVLGAYFRLYPYARVLTLVPPFWLAGPMEIPAVIWLGFWFLMQFFTGTQSLVGGESGVAWWAHVGGFVAGMVLAQSLAPQRRPRAVNWDDLS